MSDKARAAEALGVGENQIRATYDFGTHMIAVTADGQKHKLDLGSEARPAPSAVAVVEPEDDDPYPGSKPERDYAARKLGVDKRLIRATYDFGTHLIAVTQNGRKHQLSTPPAGFLERIRDVVAPKQPAPPAGGKDEGDDDTDAKAWSVEDPDGLISPQVWKLLNEKYPDGPAAVQAASDDELLDIKGIANATLERIRKVVGPFAPNVAGGAPMPHGSSAAGDESQPAGTGDSTGDPPGDDEDDDPSA